MANLNKVLLMGNLTKDPELRHTNNSAAVCSLSIAVNRKFKKDDEWKTEVQYFNIVVWGKAGENCAKYMTKGKPIFIEGRLANRSYETQDGQKRYITEIIADNVQFLNAVSGGGNKPSLNQAAQDAADVFGGSASEDDDAVPF